LGAGEGQFDQLSALGSLGELVSTGAPVDTNPAVQAAIDLANQQITDQSQQVGAEFGPLGLRFSSDKLRQDALVRERGAVGLGEIIANLVFGAQESAAGRRLQAPGVIADIAGGARQSGLSSALATLGINEPDQLPSGLAQGLAQIAPLVTTLISSGAFKKQPTNVTAPRGFTDTSALFGRR
jgi:hypothetical protein